MARWSITLPGLWTMAEAGVHLLATGDNPHHDAVLLTLAGQPAGGTFVRFASITAAEARKHGELIAS